MCRRSSPPRMASRPAGRRLRIPPARQPSATPERGVASGGDDRPSAPRRLHRRARRQQRRPRPRRRRPDRRRPGDGRPARRSSSTRSRRWASPPEAVTHVFLSHHHPDHTINVALFPNAEVVDFWARYRDDLWLDHDGDGHHLARTAQLWLTPGHTRGGRHAHRQADDGVYAMTHLWWHADRTPEIDPLASDQAALERGRARVLAAADVVIPGPRTGVPRPTPERSAARPPSHDVEPDVVDQRLRAAASATSWTNAACSSGGSRSRFGARITVRMNVSSGSPGSKRVGSSVSQHSMSTKPAASSRRTVAIGVS